jgi:hypothetical protein
MKSTSERLIQAAILGTLGRRSDVRLFRNNQVMAQRGNVTFRAGLGAGTPDMVGWVSIAGAAFFLGIEVKTSTGRPTAEQLAFLRTLAAQGGCAILAHSVDEAENELERFIRFTQEHLARGAHVRSETP